MRIKHLLFLFFISFLFIFFQQQANPQGLTTSSMSGIVSDNENNPLPSANVIAVHVPTGTQYGASTRENGQYNIQYMKVGGPYTVTVSYVGYTKAIIENIYLELGQERRLDVQLSAQVIEGGEVVVTGERNAILNSNRTGAETVITPREVTLLPSIKRSTRDLTRLDPRSDGNFSFGGKNWLYNNISLDGSYFNNPFGRPDKCRARINGCY